MPISLHPRGVCTWLNVNSLSCGLSKRLLNTNTVLSSDIITFSVTFVVVNFNVGFLRFQRVCSWLLKAEKMMSQCLESCLEGGFVWETMWGISLELIMSLNWLRRLIYYTRWRLNTGNVYIYSTEESSWVAGHLVVLCAMTPLKLHFTKRDELHTSPDSICFNVTGYVDQWVNCL